MKKLVLGVMLMVVPLVSSATDWYIFVSQNHECVSSARASEEYGAPMTPLAFRNFLRTHPSYGYSGYKVYHHKDWRAVVLYYGGDGGGMLFFSNKASCQNFRQSLTSSGQGLNQLK